MLARTSTIRWIATLWAINAILCLCILLLYIRLLPICWRIAIALLVAVLSIPAGSIVQCGG